MNVTCPQCGTVYRLPEDNVKPGVKLRCSVCRHIFLLPMQTDRVGNGDGGLSLNFEAGPGSEQSHGRSELDFSSGTEKFACQEKSGLDLGIRKEGRAEELGNASSSELSLKSSHAGGLDLSLEDNAAHGSSQGLQLSGDSPRGSSHLDDLELPKARRPRFQGLFTTLLCIVIVASGWWMWENTPYLNGFKQLISPYTSGDSLNTEPASPVAGLELRDVRQYAVKNKKIGDLVVIEGKVHNGAPSAREFIRLEASLYDAQGAVLSSQKQLAGTSMSPFQLEVLDKEELENALNSRLDIVSANMNVQSGSEVPFIVVFTDIPEGASDFKVRIIEAELPEKPGNLTE